MNIWDGGRRRVYMQEVGTRDGFQSEGIFVETRDKIALIDMLSKTGMAKIEVTAFVSPQAIPALRDAEIVLREIERNPGVIYTALVPNVRGAERAIDAHADELNLVMSASESHNLSNLRMTRDQSFNALKQVAAIARDAGLPVNISLSCAFGCPMEGDVSASTVLEWAERFVEEIGSRGVTLCDTTGMAYPRQVAELTSQCVERWPQTELTLHFHNTRGMGLANVLAAIDAGANRFDASLGGIGGCPYAPGASGNVCSEEIVHALELMGYDTGVDLDALIAAARCLPPLIGHDTPSQIVKAGRRLDLHPLPADFAAVRERTMQGKLKPKPHYGMNIG
ncbi:HMGL-like family protein [Paraburkholderia xenovorans LB400]|jgi:hydroxymethylglutaryl-CoA lyase|uniref:Hydroxymethylglutaryl-CoA lyase n=1 Tax=Paraburkholderia xenovorans (strain LB400) TaxID=266265 RepID=Q140K4_PARXL|nr:hydroxymethylglutaryl-CoA lyase [Paraburkholderia xenovorans]ABE30235.1 hydroxymethylglutaryl-CoA lyase [Paraburkholderia xenovorans LB400]AIP31526.1 HMGL-like family protein [Paraburkholderia xenovorans LB400]